MAKDRELPWEPREPLQISPSEYERQVIEWLKSAGATLPGLLVRHQQKLVGQSGEYSLDGVADFEIFRGARVRILIECKRHNRPIERDVILAMQAKLQDLGANKAMIFSTSGFQSGALEYASEHGIAAVVFVDGKFNYFTKSEEPTPVSNFPSDLPQFAGNMVVVEKAAISVSVISDDHLIPLIDWLQTLSE